MRWVMLVGLLACSGVKVKQEEAVQAVSQSAATADTSVHIGPAVEDTAFSVTLPAPETPADVAPLTPLAAAVASQHRAPAKPPAPPASVSFKQNNETPAVDVGVKAKGEGEAKGKGKQGQTTEVKDGLPVWVYGLAALVVIGLAVFLFKRFA